MAIEKENSVVGIEYEVKESGTDTVIDSNKGSRPLEFVTGKGQIIPGLEAGLVGMGIGESRTITVKAAEAYGEVNPEARQSLPREQFEGIDLEEGMALYGEGENGETVQVTVLSFNDDEVTIDFNHPLAGKDLEFEVTVTQARPATEEEATTGQVGGLHCADGSCGCGH
jgi:FKBP-type peptidyl-prolyl cis-trans isomerase SlyD